ncbi:MAG: TolC family protein [Acidobacteriota bacterium]|jgi:outer membrane protein TolC
MSPRFADRSDPSTPAPAPAVPRSGPRSIRLLTGLLAGALTGLLAGGAAVRAADPSPFLLERIPGLRDVPVRVPPPGEADLDELPRGPRGGVELDLERVVELALGRNPALKAAEERIDEVIGGIEEARAEAFPQLAVTGSWSRSRNPAFLNNPDFEDIVSQFPGGSFEPSEQELWSGAVEVSQPLYTFGKIRAAIRLARLAGAVTDAQIEAARLETALVAAEAYFELLAAERAVEVVEAQQRARRSALEVVEARYEIGEATRLELLRSRSSLTELGPEIARRRGDVEVAAARLRVSLGLPAATRISALGAERRLPPPRDLDALLDLALEQRPELADLRAQREALEKQQQVTRADGKPQVELNGFYGRQVRLPDNFTDPLYADWSVAVGLRWELFDGGRRRGRIAQLESQRQQLGWELRDLENRIVLDLETALAGYRAAIERLDAAEVAAESAREAVRVAEETYREGVTLQADLLDARQEEVRAEIERIDSIFSARIEAARLARAVGEYPEGTGWAVSGAGASGPVRRSPGQPPANSGEVEANETP